MKNPLTRIDPDLRCILLLLLLGLVAYAETFCGGFHFDDFPRIVENDAIVDLTALGTIYAYCKERFLTYLSLALNYQIGKLDPTGYHIFNFFVHYVAALFLYFLFLETLKTPALAGTEWKFSKRGAALLVAGVFLLHPLQTQSVTYIIQRAESMAGMFYLAALFFYVKARLAESPRRVWACYLLVVLSALGAAFSKETAVTLPVLIVAFEVLFFKASIFRLVGNRVIIFTLIPAGMIVAYKLGLLVQRGFYYDSGISFTRSQYLLTQFSVLVTYLRLFFWPAGQNLDWDYPVAVTLFNFRTFASLCLLLAVALLAVAAYRRSRLLSFGIVGFFVTLAPTSSIIPIADLIYEHRMYLAVAFLAMGSVHALLIALGKLDHASSRWGCGAFFTVIGLSLPLLTGLTYARNGVWMNEISLWSDVVQKSPNKARAHLNYGRALWLYGLGNLDRAKEEFELARKLCPQWPKPYYNLAFIYGKLGDPSMAIRLDLEAINLQPDYADALYLLGQMYREMGEWERARVSLERLISLSPGSRFLRAYVDLLDVYLNMNLEDEAVRVAQAMERIPGALPYLDYYRGLAFYRLEDYSKAKSYFSKQAKSTSWRALSHLMLGQICYLQGEDGKAEEAFRRVLAEQPWSAAAHYNLGILLEKRGSLREAAEHLEKALAVRPFSLALRIDSIRLHDHLGDRVKQAEMLRKVLGLKPGSAEASFLMANSQLDLDETLSRYSETFCSGNPSPGSVKTRAVIATLRGQLAEAIDLYQAYLEAISDRTEMENTKKEISRLQGLLRGKEPLEVPT